MTDHRGPIIRASTCFAPERPPLIEWNCAPGRLIVCIRLPPPGPYDSDLVHSQHPHLSIHLGWRRP